MTNYWKQRREECEKFTIVVSKFETTVKLLPFLMFLQKEVNKESNKAYEK